MGAVAGVELALAWLNTKDPIQRELYETMNKRIAKKREILERNLAIEIANAVGKLFEK